MNKETKGNKLSKKRIVLGILAGTLTEHILFWVTQIGIDSHLIMPASLLFVTIGGLVSGHIIHKKGFLFGAITGSYRYLLLFIIVPTISTIIYLINPNNPQPFEFIQTNIELLKWALVGIIFGGIGGSIGERLAYPILLKLKVKNIFSK